MRGWVFLVGLGLAATACGGSLIDASQSTASGTAEPACVAAAFCEPSTTLPAPREVREVGDPPGVVEISDDETRLTLQWGEGGCTYGERLDLEETDERVVITLVLVDATPPPTRTDQDGEVVYQACTMILRQKVGVVTLAAPLGDRDVETHVVIRTEP